MKKEGIVVFSNGFIYGAVRYLSEGGLPNWSRTSLPLNRKKETITADLYDKQDLSDLLE